MVCACQLQPASWSEGSTFKWKQAPSGTASEKLTALLSAKLTSRALPLIDALVLSTRQKKLV